MNEQRNERTRRRDLAEGQYIHAYAYIALLYLHVSSKRHKCFVHNILSRRRDIRKLSILFRFR